MEDFSGITYISILVQIKKLINKKMIKMYQLIMQLNLKAILLKLTVNDQNKNIQCNYKNMMNLIYLTCKKKLKMNFYKMN